MLVAACPPLGLACGDGDDPLAPPPTAVAEDLADQPLRGSDAQQLRTFRAGDALFEVTFRESDGIGPLLIRTSCGACHGNGGKGPGLVRKLQILEADGRPAAAPVELAYGNTERPYAAGGATLPLLAPDTLAEGHTLRTSERIGPTVLGRGYIEAVAESEILRLAAAQASHPDGIAGRVSRVTYHSRPHPGLPFPHALGETNLVGRFGLKARIATLEDFTADAFQGDMGLTSSLRPQEVPNPEGLPDDRRPGLDLEDQALLDVSGYVRLLEIPARHPVATDPGGPGAAAFERAGCAACHVPTLRTRPDYPVPQLAGIDAPIYSDLLLHDMGEALADYIPEEGAGPREWRTAPLIGLRFQRSFLHDGRARTLEEAVLQHAGTGSQANPAVTRFQALDATERRALLEFVGAL